MRPRPCCSATAALVCELGPTAALPSASEIAGVLAAAAAAWAPLVSGLACRLSPLSALVLSRSISIARTTAWPLTIGVAWSGVSSRPEVNLYFGFDSEDSG